jgi:hypothetical protein
MQTATYTKLRSGDWGIRVAGTVSTGEKITVRKRDGSTKEERIAKVVWSGNGVSLCTIGAARQSSGRYGRYSSYGRRGGKRCPECGGYNPWGDPCGEPCD